METANHKGRELEEAVRAIESTILSFAPGHSEKTFRIEGRRVIEVDGVRHEVDISVDVNLAPGYGARFIFECKNWIDKVGKNEIIVFSEKVRALQAQRGFFVAKSFTADGRAQAAKDHRIGLLVATEMAAAEVPTPLSFHVFGVEARRGEMVAVIPSVAPEAEGTSIDPTTALALLRGEKLDLILYLNARLRDLEERCKKRSETHRLPDGLHQLREIDQRKYEPGVLLMNGHKVETLVVTGTFTVRIIRPAVLSLFQVEHRGRAYSLAPVDVPGGTLEVRMVSLLGDGTG